MALFFHDDARRAIELKDGPKAISSLNRLLALPSNSHTEAAQALIGEARELTGEYGKARAEYQLYLKLFPSGTESARISDRLASLPTTDTRPLTPVARAATGKDSAGAEWTTYGSISQYLYTGQSHIEVTTPPPPGQLTFNTDILSLTDQDALISTIDLNARKRDGAVDTRIVFRDVETNNHLVGRKDTSRLNNAYIEQTDREKGYMFRVGRQNPSGSGVMERFDGVTVGYNLNRDWRVNGVTGTPVEFRSPFKKSFYAVSLDRVAQPGKVGYSAYFLEQTLDGSINRRALGAEMRYFDAGMTLYGLVDYDLSFKDINIMMAQVNYRLEDGTNFFAVLDRRKTPPLALTSALMGNPGVMSVKELVSTLGIDEVRRQATAMAAESSMFSIGFTRPVTPRWQLGADYRLASISSSEGTLTMPGQPGTGNSHVISGQAIGTGLFRENDVLVGNTSLIHAPTYNGQAYGFNFVVPYREVWRFDFNLQMYNQRTHEGETMKRFAPSVKASYRWRNSVSLEMEAGNEEVRTNGPTKVETSRRHYLYMGYRWDFR